MTIVDPIAIHIVIYIHPSHTNTCGMITGCVDLDIITLLARIVLSTIQEKIIFVYSVKFSLASQLCVIIIPAKSGIQWMIAKYDLPGLIEKLPFFSVIINDLVNDLVI